MHISRSSDPLFKDRLVMTSYEENTEQSGIKVWLLVLFLLGSAVAAGVYFWPQLSPHWDDLMAQVNTSSTETDAEPVAAAQPVASVSVSTEEANTTVLTPAPASSIADTEQASIKTSETEAETVITALAEPSAAAPVSVDTTTEANATANETEIVPVETTETATAETDSNTMTALNDVNEVVATDIAPVSTDNTADQVANLVKQAKNQIQRTRFTSPKGDNAYETAQALRQLDAAAADEVENDILTWYHNQAQEYLDKKRLFPPGKGNAYTMYQRMYQISPNHAQVQALQNILIESQQALVKPRLKAGHIIEPEGESAYEVYQVLASYFPDAKATQQLRTKMINTLLERGEYQLQQRKFTTPEDDNAYDTFSAILQIEENNAKGLAGLDKVVLEYVRLGRLRMKQGRHEHARTLVERGLEIAPDNDELLKLKETLDSRAQAPSARNEVDLLALAEQQLASGLLSRPKGNNASETYQRLKKKLSNTDGRLLGLGRQLGESYFNLARQQFIDNKPEQSLKTVTQGLTLLGTHEKLVRFQKELELLLDE